MISKKPIANKFYKYAGSIVKIKKISKSKNKIFIEKLTNKEVITIPYEQSEILIINDTVDEIVDILVENTIKSEAAVVIENDLDLLRSSKLVSSKKESI